MDITKKVRKRFDFLTTSYGLMCVVDPKKQVVFYNDKITITFAYDFYRHEYFDLSISENNTVVMKVNYGNVSWGDKVLADEKLSQRLQNIFKLRHQFITLSEKKLDELIEIYADYLEDYICK